LFKRLAKLIGYSEREGTTSTSYFILDLALEDPATPFLLKVGGAVRLSNSLCSSGTFGSSTFTFWPFGGGLGIYFGASGSSPSKT
jgi:hypothetical protein